MLKQVSHPSLPIALLWLIERGKESRRAASFTILASHLHSFDFMKLETRLTTQPASQPASQLADLAPRRSCIPLLDTATWPCQVITRTHFLFLQPYISQFQLKLFYCGNYRATKTLHLMSPCTPVSVPAKITWLLLPDNHFNSRIRKIQAEQ